MQRGRRFAPAAECRKFASVFTRREMQRPGMEPNVCGRGGGGWEGRGGEGQERNDRLPLGRTLLKPLLVVVGLFYGSSGPATLLLRLGLVDWKCCGRLHKLPHIPPIHSPSPLRPYYWRRSVFIGCASQIRRDDRSIALSGSLALRPLLRGFYAVVTNFHGTVNMPYLRLHSVR